MLPIYNAQSFIKLIDKGGRTEPWVVMVDTGEAVKPYVVKLFQKVQEDERHSVVNEVLGNVLAEQFGLNVPKAALIEFSDAFMMTLPREQQRLVDERDERIKFGCEMLEGCLLFDPSLPRTAIKKRIEAETVFALDVLIRNRDRNFKKPNILMHQTGAFLIDHELAFEGMPEARKLVQAGLIDPQFAEHHVLLPFLKSGKAAAKAEYFELFEFYLQGMNFNMLNAYFKQLYEYGFETNQQVIGAYLNDAKQNSVRFVAALRGITQ